MCVSSSTCLSVPCFTYACGRLLVLLQLGCRMHLLHAHMHTHPAGTVPLGQATQPPAAPRAKAPRRSTATFAEGFGPGDGAPEYCSGQGTAGTVERCMSTVVLPAVKNLMYCTRGVAAIARTLRHQFPLPLSRPPADVTPLIQYHHEAAQIAQRCNVRCCGSISSRAIPAHSVHCRR